MAESWVPPAWLEDLLSGVVINSSLFDGELRDIIDGLQTSPEPMQLDESGAIPSASAMQKELEVETETKPPAVAIPRAKPSTQGSKPRQSPSVRSDTARRMEIAQLKLEVPKLEAYVDFLMQKEVSQSGEHSSSLHKRQLINAKLRELTRLQQLWITRGLSVASNASPQSPATLFNYIIHLPREIPARVKTLCDVNAGILRDAREILRERIRFLSSSLLPCNEVSSYTTAEGDMCTSVFAATPVEGAKDVKQVLDTLRSVLTSDLDFVCLKTKTHSMTEFLDVHPDLDQHGIAHRLSMRRTATGIVTEFNGVLFSEYQADTNLTQPADKQAEGTIVIHPIEEDKLHPYTAGRMRLDVTSAMSIHHQKYSQGDEPKTESTEGIVIVRNTFIKLRRGSASISASEMRSEMNHAISKGPAALEATMALLASERSSP